MHLAKLLILCSFPLDLVLKRRLRKISSESTTVPLMENFVYQDLANLFAVMFGAFWFLFGLLFLRYKSRSTCPAICQGSELKEDKILEMETYTDTQSESGDDSDKETDSRYYADIESEQLFSQKSVRISTKGRFYKKERWSERNWSAQAGCSKIEPTHDIATDRFESGWKTVPKTNGKLIVSAAKNGATLRKFVWHLGVKGGGRKGGDEFESPVKIMSQSYRLRTIGWMSLCSIILATSQSYMCVGSLRSVGWMSSYFVILAQSSEMKLICFLAPSLYSVLLVEKHTNRVIICKAPKT